MKTFQIFFSLIFLIVLNLPTIVGQEISDEIPEGVKSVLTDHEGNQQYYVFDPVTMAMRIDFINPKNDPMYFDEDGYVYTPAGGGEYIKMHFDRIRSIARLFGNLGGDMMPSIDYEEGSITYNEKVIKPKRFPILEWAFVYKPVHFEGGVNYEKEIFTCRGEDNCTKYTLINGSERGSHILFDSQGRLAEIFSVHSGNAVYTYLAVEVTLPID
ncbi:MAG: hypothetical protein HKN68_08305 [Saprospiraceae bacterium]|nr:hypothetical protein [Saprospiraceae bacterium]